MQEIYGIRICNFTHTRSRTPSSLAILGGRAAVLLCGAGALKPAVADYFRTCTAKRRTGGTVRVLDLGCRVGCGHGLGPVLISST